MKKNLALMLILTLAAMLMIGCTKKEETPETSDDEIKAITIGMYEFLCEYANGNEDAKCEVAEAFVNNWQKVLDNGDVEENGEYYPAPSYVEEVSNAVNAYYDDYMITIYKDGYKAEAICIFADEPVGLDALDDTAKELVTESMENLYSAAEQFSEGVAQLNEIPITYTQYLYDYSYEIVGYEEHAPISVREYAETNTVYFDYDFDVSVVWDKSTNTATIMDTDIAERDAYMEKEHR